MERSLLLGTGLRGTGLRGTGRRGTGWLVRATGVALVGFATVLGLSACIPPSTPAPGPQSTYQILGTSVMSDDKSVGLRDLYVADPGPDGYKPGSAAPLSMEVWNNTNAPISLVSASVSGTVPVVLVGAGGEATGTGPPTATTFDVPVQPSGNVPLSQAAGRYLQIGCLSAVLPSGSAVEVTFTFSNGATITTPVPVGPQLPASPAVPVALAATGC